MPPLKAGDSFPEDITFSYIPWSSEKSDIKACGTPITYDASKEFASKKVVIVGVPGAFTPTCSETHLPGFISKAPEFKAKGVGQIVVLAYNDAFVQSAWAKANGVEGSHVIFASDPGAKFSSGIGWHRPDGRLARYAIVVDHGKVVYAEKEPDTEVTVSGAEAVLKAL